MRAKFWLELDVVLDSDMAATVIEAARRCLPPREPRPQSTRMARPEPSPPSNSETRIEDTRMVKADDRTVLRVRSRSRLLLPSDRHAPSPVHLARGSRPHVDQHRLLPGSGLVT